MPTDAPGDSPGLKVGFGTPFQAQIDFLRKKLALPTARWDDIQAAANDRAFIVAGAVKADLLSDLQGSLVRAAEGAGFKGFQKDFKDYVAKHGWTGWTGEGTKAGEAWRTRIIYDTNLTTSYWAGQYARYTDPGYLRFHPYWRYIHDDSVAHPRAHHLAWHGLTLPHDHPFWKTHFAPNGFNCKCRITTVTRAEGEASARAGLGEPPKGWDTIDPKTGAQVGIGKGFDYTPGASTKVPLQKFVDTKLINLQAPIGAQMWEALKPLLLEERTAAWQTTFDATRKTMQAGNNAQVVHTIAPATVTDLAAIGVVLENAAVYMRDTELLHALRDYKANLSNALPDEVWRNLPLQLDTATPYFDNQNKNLVYAIDLPEKLGKVVVEINFNTKGRIDGVRTDITSNFAITGGVVSVKNLTTGKQYLPLKK